MRAGAIGLAIGLIGLLTPLAAGEVIIYGGLTDHPLDPGASLTDVRLGAVLGVLDGRATLRLTNLSVAPETSAVFKEIVLDTYDDDTGVALLWDPVVLTDTKDVSYDFGPSNGLPGYQDLTSDPVALLEFQANPSPVKRGLGPGETMEIVFATSLADGSDMADYVAAFGGGSDAGNSVLGFHAISADVVGGQSLSGMGGDRPVPEPAALTVLGVCGLLGWRRRRLAPARPRRG